MKIFKSTINGKVAVLFSLMMFALFGMNMHVNAYELSEDGSTLIIYGQNNLGKTVDIDMTDSYKTLNSRPDGSYTKIKMIGHFTGWSSGWLKSQDDNKSAIVELDLSEASFAEYIVPSADNNYQGSGGWSFMYFSNLKTIVWPVASESVPTPIKNFPASAFSFSGIEELSIPTYVQRIETNAFESNSSLKTVIIPENSSLEMIKTHAFGNCYNIKDVYVNANKAITCEHEAFLRDVTNNQSLVNQGVEYAALHYPKNYESHYVNLSHTLDYTIASDAGKLQKWLTDHVDHELAKTNGWYEFVKAGAKEDTPVYNGHSFLRTFSDNNTSRIVPDGVKAYIVNGLTEISDDLFQLNLVSINVIPKGTGVILYGQTNANTEKGKQTLIMTPVELSGTSPLKRSDNGSFSSLTKGNQQFINFLMPSSNLEEGNEVGVTVRPYDTKSDGSVEYRNFYMSRFNTTSTSKLPENAAISDNKYVGFFRSKTLTMSPGYAYLHMKSDEYKLSEGSEIVIVKDDYYDCKKGSKTEKEYKEGTNTYWKYARWEYNYDLQDNQKGVDWGIRPNVTITQAKFMGEPVFVGEEEEDIIGIATKINEVQISEEATYYNLQGLKVNRPVHGIYIKNGKKVFVK